LGEQNIESPISTLIGAVALNIYPMLAVALVVFVILTGKDVGEMKRAETRAATEGKIIRDGAVPMIAGEITMMEAKAGVTPKAVCGAILVSMILNKAQGIMGVREMVDVILKGMSGMLPLALLMVFAFALGSLCKDLGTGQYVAEQAKPFLSPALVPALIFLISAFIAFSTGTSWGTFAIMIAIAVPLSQGLDTNMTLAVAAALGGGVFGDHCSPTSDTSIITSMATANDHIDHVRTQLPYALIGGAITTALYLILGFLGV